MTIIDFHTHVDEAPAFGWIDPPDKIVALLDEAGIDMAVAMTYTDLPGLNPDALDYILDAVARFPDRLVAFVRLNPNYRAEAAAALEEGIARGARGLKLHPTTTLAHPADEPTVALLRRCGELGVPALFHCGDDPYTTPQTMALAAAAAPDTAIVLGHMGGYLHVEEAIDAAMEHSNVYLETSAMPYPEHIRTAIDRVGPERVLFGSDGPGCNPRLELDKVRSLALDAGRRSTRPRRQRSTAARVRPMIVDALVVAGENRFRAGGLTLAELAAAAAAVGIDGLVAAPGRPLDYHVGPANDALADAARSVDMPVARLGRVDPLDGDRAIAEAARCLDELGCAGLFLHPGEEVFPVRVASPVVSVAASRGVPVVVAAGAYALSEPLQLFEFARAHPDVNHRDDLRRPAQHLRPRHDRRVVRPSSAPPTCT